MPRCVRGTGAGSGRPNRTVLIWVTKSLTTNYDRSFEWMTHLNNVYGSTGMTHVMVQMHDGLKRIELEVSSGGSDLAYEGRALE